MSKAYFDKLKSDMISEIRESLIDKSTSSEIICSKTFAQIAFAKEYGFFMPTPQLREFVELCNIYANYQGSTFSHTISSKLSNYKKCLVQIKLQQEKLLQTIQQ